MKRQKPHSNGEKHTYPPAADHCGAAASERESTRHARAPFDDLHARITIRAYELYIQRGCREGGSQEDWLDAEREIAGRDFPT